MRYSARPSTAEGHYYRLLRSNITIPRCCTGLRNSHRRSSSSRYAGMSPANGMRRTGPPCKRKLPRLFGPTKAPTYVLSQMTTPP